MKPLAESRNLAVLLNRMPDAEIRLGAELSLGGVIIGVVTGVVVLDGVGILIRLQEAQTKPAAEAT